MVTPTISDISEAAHVKNEYERPFTVSIIKTTLVSPVSEHKSFDEVAMAIKEVALAEGMLTGSSLGDRALAKISARGTSSLLGNDVVNAVVHVALGGPDEPMVSTN